MDKQEAIDFVLDELDKGRSPAEITAALSRRLGAPVDLVSKFVRQTGDPLPAVEGCPGEPSACEPTSHRRSSQQPSAFSAQPSSRQPAASRLHANSRWTLARSLQDPANLQAAASQQPVAFDGQAAGIGAVEEALPLPNASIRCQRSRLRAPAEREAAVSAELEKFILDELGKDKARRRCGAGSGREDRHGIPASPATWSRGWALENYKKVTARQNCLIIPLAADRYWSPVWCCWAPA